MKIRQFKTEQWLPLPPGELFTFFSDARNLDQITPAWLHFEILAPEGMKIQQGSLIDYRLRVHGIPLRWQTRINLWEPPHRFVDEQIRGPYRRWIHEHTFELAKGGTLARDLVNYAVPADFLVHRLFVLRDIRKIFEFRAESLRKRFTEHR